MSLTSMPTHQVMIQEASDRCHNPWRGTSCPIEHFVPNPIDECVQSIIHALLEKTVNAQVSRETKILCSYYLIELPVCRDRRKPTIRLGHAKSVPTLWVVVRHRINYVGCDSKCPQTYQVALRPHG